MNRALPVRHNGELQGYMIFCPACKCGHIAAVNSDYYPSGATWTFNGSQSLPSFSPSLLINGRGFICHSNVSNGTIFFYEDSTHELAGKTVELPDFDAMEGKA